MIKMSAWNKLYGHCGGEIAIMQRNATDSYEYINVSAFYVLSGGMFCSNDMKLY